MIQKNAEDVRRLTFTATLACTRMEPDFFTSKSGGAAAGVMSENIVVELVQRCLK